MIAGWWQDARSPNPARAAVERWYLLFTPVWTAVVGLLMVGGFVARWGDGPCMVLGASLAAGALLPPILRPHPDEAHLPWTARTGTAVGLGPLLLALGVNYTQTPFFFDVLHMHYGFQTTWNIANNPFFLYLLSAAYFATYFALCAMSFRLMRARLPTALRGAAWILAPFAMAFLETALNANPFIPTLFCYDDLPFMLTFGTVAYGMCFVYALPGWMHVREAPGSTTPALHMVVLMLAALYADLLTLDLLRYHVAPHLTTVVTGAQGLRDHPSCLVPLSP